MTLDLVTAGATAALTGVVQLLVWLAIRRAIEARDKEMDLLGAEVKDLRERRMTTAENGLERAAEQRKGIYERLEKMGKEYVLRADCVARHKEQSDRDERFMASVLKLERVEANLSHTAHTLSEVHVEQIAMGKELAAVAERVRGMREG